jgi:hypothetical protein
MGSRNSCQSQRPRELRRRVVVPARLRHGASWSDTCILNLSSRGLMIHTNQQVAPGTAVEIRRGDHVIIARVMWRSGGRAGLQAEESLAVEEIMTVGQSPALRLTADNGGDRRRYPRPEDRSRAHGRMIEFAGAGVVALSLAAAALSMVEQAFARPIAIVTAALGG